MKAIVFDITGVIFPYQPWIGERPPKDKFKLIKEIGALGYVAGQTTKEGLREQIYTSDLPTHELDAIYKSLTVADETLLKLIEKLSHQYDLYCIANEAKHWTDIRKEITRFDTYFKKLYISVEIGFRKPDKEIYEFFLTDTGFMAGDCLFIDDKQKNVDAATALGFKGYIYDTVDNLESFLREANYL